MCKRTDRENLRGFTLRLGLMEFAVENRQQYSQLVSCDDVNVEVGSVGVGATLPAWHLGGDLCLRLGTRNDERQCYPRGHGDLDE